MITVNGDPLEHVPGMTISQILEKRNFKFRLLIIKVNGELIERDKYDEVVVPDGAVVDVIHLMSGG